MASSSEKSTFHAGNVSRRKNNTSKSNSHEITEDEKENSSRMRRKESRAQTVVVALSITIFVGSILRENEMVPDSFFSNKQNPLNQHFVKWSWGWTLCIMTPFLLALSWARHPGKLMPPVRCILRLGVLTAMWYFWVEIVMNTVQERTGKCSIESHGDSRACRRGGGRWDGFDISGHSFMLVFIILTTQEELAPFWHLYETSGVRFTFPSSKGEMRTVPVLSFLLQILLHLLAIIVSLMQSLSFVMVMATSLYFHDISHKLIGTALAIVSWYLTYRTWFMSEFFTLSS